MSIAYVFAIVGIFYFRIPQNIIALILYLADGARFKMIFHYVEYSFHGNKRNTWDYGPLDDLAGPGLIEQIESRGGKVIFHQQGNRDLVLNVMNSRQPVKPHTSTAKAANNTK